jgi:hypothetical protein
MTRCSSVRNPSISACRCRKGERKWHSPSDSMIASIPPGIEIHRSERCKLNFVLPAEESVSASVRGEWAKTIGLWVSPSNRARPGARDEEIPISGQVRATNTDTRCRAPANRKLPKDKLSRPFGARTFRIVERIGAVLGRASLNTASLRLWGDVLHQSATVGLPRAVRCAALEKLPSHLTFRYQAFRSAGAHRFVAILKWQPMWPDPAAH